MSRGGGYVVKDGHTVAYFIYDGGSDLAYSRLFKFYDEAWEVWRRGNADLWADHGCGQPDEPVRLHTDYGAGSSWNGRACFHCMAITTGFSPWDEEKLLDRQRWLRDGGRILEPPEIERRERGARP